MTSGGASYAFDGRGGEWEWFEEQGRNVPIAEIRQQAAVIAGSDGRAASRDFLALVSTKIKLAEQGALAVPVDGRPHLFRAEGVKELKWSVDGVQWRLYYCEPLTLYTRRGMLALHFARKESLGQQDTAIDEAARRWAAWHARQPG